MFLVKYRDDFQKLHICVATTIGELRFVQSRFEVIDYSPVEP